MFTFSSIKKLLFSIFCIFFHFSEAAESVGFNVLRIILEPAAALLAYGKNFYWFYRNWKKDNLNCTCYGFIFQNASILLFLIYFYWLFIYFIHRNWTRRYFNWMVCIFAYRSYVSPRKVWHYRKSNYTTMYICHQKTYKFGLQFFTFFTLKYKLKC